MSDRKKLRLSLKELCRPMMLESRQPYDPDSIDTTGEFCWRDEIV